MRVGIALGSNLGDRLANLRSAVAALREFTLPPLLASAVYETVPVDCPPGAPPFLNAAVEVGYSGDLFALLKNLQTIEVAHRRPSDHARNSPRTLDLDLLYADDLTLHSPELILPHPRLITRAFVLAPLNDIAPGRILPGLIQPISTLFAQVDSTSVIRYNYL